MDNKPKKKWTSNRLKNKKKELGLEDKESPEEANSSREGKKTSKPVRKASKNRKDKSDSRKKGSYKKGSGKRGSYKKNSDKRGSRNRNREKHVIKISNLPSDISVVELADLISPWGEIGNINIKNYSEAYVSYVDFFNKEEADYFIKALDQTPFDNMIIRTELMNFS
tara:strand:+ start:1349 stop:1849 length:501 start_codon:yes stop_codon:yes gene_type:complete